MAIAFALGLLLGARPTLQRAGTAAVFTFAAHRLAEPALHWLGPR